MEDRKSYFINYNEKLPGGKFDTEKEAREFGKVLCQDDWNEDKIVEVTWYGK